MKIFKLLFVAIFLTGSLGVMAEKSLDDQLFDALMGSLQSIDIEKVKSLISKGANVNAERRTHDNVYVSVTPLSMVAFHIDRPGSNLSNEEAFEVFELLLEHGADINFVTYGFGNVFKEKSVETIKKLIAMGADPKIKALDGWTNLTLAVETGRFDLVEYYVNDLCLDVNEISTFWNLGGSDESFVKGTALDFITALVNDPEYMKREELYNTHYPSHFGKREHRRIQKFLKNIDPNRSCTPVDSQLVKKSDRELLEDIHRMLNEVLGKIEESNSEVVNSSIRSIVQSLPDSQETQGTGGVAQ